MSVPPLTPKPRRGAVVIVAMLALIFAIFSAFMSAWALKKANDAGDRADRLAAQVNQSGPPAAPPAEATPEPSLTPAGTDSAGPPTEDAVAPSGSAEVSLDPQRVWDVKYAPRDLTVEVTRRRYVDLDAPQVDDETDQDIYLVNVLGGAVKIGFGEGVQVASADSDAIRPYDCNQRMQYSPLDATMNYTFRKGDSFCVQTSRQAAELRAESQQMVVVKVKDISIDGTVVLTARAWKVPA
jgi:hypothetical protein